MRLGMKHSAETRQKMREAALGRKASPETLRNMSAAMHERWETPEYRERMLAVLKREQAKGSAAGCAAMAAKPRLSPSEHYYRWKLRNALGKEATREILGVRR